MSKKKSTQTKCQNRSSERMDGVVEKFDLGLFFFFFFFFFQVEKKAVICTFFFFFQNVVLERK